MVGLDVSNPGDEGLNYPYKGLKWDYETWEEGWNEANQADKPKISKLWSPVLKWTSYCWLLSLFLCIKVLMKFKGKEIDVNEEGDRGGTPLHCAAYYDHAQCAKILVCLQNSL